MEIEINLTKLEAFEAYLKQFKARDMFTRTTKLNDNIERLRNICKDVRLFLGRVKRQPDCEDHRILLSQALERFDALNDIFNELTN